MKICFYTPTTFKWYRTPGNESDFWLDVMAWVAGIDGKTS